MKVYGTGWEIGQLSKKPTAGEALITQGLGDVGAMNAVDSLGKELTVFPGAVPDFDGTDAGALAVVDDRPTLDGNGESEQFIFCREVNVAAVALRGGACWRVGENGDAAWWLWLRASPF